jgi:hypothetical protein
MRERQFPHLTNGLIALLVYHAILILPAAYLAADMLGLPGTPGFWGPVDRWTTPDVLVLALLAGVAVALLLASWGIVVGSTWGVLVGMIGHVIVTGVALAAIGASVAATLPTGGQTGAHGHDEAAAYTGAAIVAAGIATGVFVPLAALSTWGFLRLRGLRKEFRVQRACRSTPQ